MYIFGLGLRVIPGIYLDDGKENGSYYSIIGYIGVIWLYCYNGKKN